MCRKIRFFQELARHLGVRHWFCFALIPGILAWYCQATESPNFVIIYADDLESSGMKSGHERHFVLATQ